MESTTVKPKADIKPKSSLRAKFRILTFRWDEAKRAYKCIYCINTTNAHLLEDHQSEPGDKTFNRELVAACTAMRLELLQENPESRAWRVKGRFLDNKSVPYPSRADYERDDVVVYFKGTTSRFKACASKWRVDAEARELIDSRARTEKPAAQVPDVGRDVLEEEAESRAKRELESAPYLRSRSRRVRFEQSS